VFGTLWNRCHAGGWSSTPTRERYFTVPGHYSSGTVVASTLILRSVWLSDLQYKVKTPCMASITASSHCCLYPQVKEVASVHDGVTGRRRPHSVRQDNMKKITNSKYVLCRQPPVQPSGESRIQNPIYNVALSRNCMTGLRVNFGAAFSTILRRIA